MDEQESNKISKPVFEEIENQTKIIPDSMERKYIVRI